MPIRSQRLGRGVSMLDADNSWASQVLASATTNIADMARFQQRQLLEKEQKLMQLYDQQQLRAHQVAQRGSAGSNGSNSSGNGTSSTVSHHQTVTRTTTSTHSNSNPPAGGKVRQMFDERRQTSVKGIDKSYPLEPLDNRSRKQQSTTTTSNVVVSSSSPMKNGNPMSNRQSLVMRRTVRSEANSNVNGGKPIVSYHEEVSRESCGPTERDNDQEEFGDDDNEDSRYANGNRHVDQRNEMHIEDVTNDNFTQRHRTTAKIHLSEFDSNEANRIVDNLENEQFPEDLMIDTPDRLPRRAPAPKKPSQAEARLERFKNSNTKRPGPATKHVAGNTTSYTKKRTETNVHSGSTSRVTKSPSPDIGVKRSMEGRARTPTASVRRSVPSSPAKSPDATARHVSAELKRAGPRPLVRTSPSPSAASARENRMHSEVSRTAEYSDCVDGPAADNSELTITETVTSTTTKRNDAFVVEFDDDEVSPSKQEDTFSSQGKPPLRKQSTEKSLTSQKTQRSPTATPLPRPASALSTSSTGSARGQSSHLNSKSRMATKSKMPASSGAKGPPGGPKPNAATPAANDGLAPCKICGRRFNSDRITLHEQICSKTATKKRKQFDATIHRVKGTELEQFVVKKGNGKKGTTDRKTSKPEVKSNWRRKHEDFINAIRSAKQVQAHLAAGGKLSDLPPPPASDTSDYIQCPHCGRKFNQAAAERHIPKCQNMMHNKPNPRAPPKPKR